VQREILPVILEAAWILKRQDAKDAKLGEFRFGSTLLNSAFWWLRFSFPCGRQRV
jgi:hypothetical protein